MPGQKINSGFTLVEMLLAFTVMLLSFLFFLNLLPTSYQGSKMAENLSLASSLGNEILEKIHTGKFSQVPLGISNGFKVYNGVGSGVPFSTRFDYTLSVSSLAPTLKEVQLEISWREKAAAGSRQKSLRMETLKYGNP